MVSELTGANREIPNDRRVVGIMQPVFLPWLGYFEQLAYADIFVFLDDVQYTKHDWRNRNRIKSSSGAQWLTVPIHRKALGAQIREIDVNYQHKWIEKHIRTIRQNYSKAPHFEPLFSEIVAILHQKPVRLTELDEKLTKLLCRHLEIETRTVTSSEIQSGRRAGADPDLGDLGERHGSKNRRILRICRDLRATTYYTGASAADYLDESLFARFGIGVVFQSYEHPIYPQRHGPFESHLSAIDLVMNTGPRAPAIMRSSPIPGGLCRTEQDALDPFGDNTS